MTCINNSRNENFDICNNIVNDNNTNICKIKYLNGINEFNDKLSSEKLYKYGSLNIQKENQCRVEIEDKYKNLLKNNKNEHLDKVKPSISGKIYQKEYYQNEKNKKRIIKSKYVEILPEKKDYIRAKLVNLHFVSKKSSTNNKYDFYGDNCSFLKKDNENSEDCVYNDKELISKVKRKNNYIYTNDNNDIMFLNTSFFKKKLNHILEDKNSYTLNVDELDMNKNENKSWKQNILQKQLETLNEATDKTKFHNYRRAESVENIENNEIKNNEVLLFNDETFDDENIAIFKNIQNELIEEEHLETMDNNDNIVVKNLETNDFIETDNKNNAVKSRENESSNLYTSECFTNVFNRVYNSRRPSISNHLYHYKQSKDIFNLTDKPLEIHSINSTLNNRKDQNKRKNKDLMLESFDDNDDGELNENSFNEFLVNVDLNKNLLKYKNFSLRNYSEDCLDKMLMNYPAINTKKNIRFNLNNNATDEPKKAESPDQNNSEAPETATSKKSAKGKSTKAQKKSSNDTSKGKKNASKDSKDTLNGKKKGSKKESNNISNDKKNTSKKKSGNDDLKKKSNSTLNKSDDPKKKSNSTLDHSSDSKRRASISSSDNSSEIKRKLSNSSNNNEIEKKEENSSRNTNHLYIFDLIEKNNNIPFNEKIQSFKLFQIELNILLKMKKKEREQTKNKEVIEFQKKKDLKLLELLRKVHEENQIEAMAMQEQETSKKGGKKIKRIPSSDEKDRRMSTGQTLAVPSDNTNTTTAKPGLSINSIFQISVLVSNIRNQAHLKEKKSNENIYSSKYSEFSESEEKEFLPEEFKQKLDDTKKELKLDEKNIKILKQYDVDLKDGLREKIKRNILKYEVKNIKKYYRKKDVINIYNLSSKETSKNENKQMNSISHTGSLMDIKTYNKMDTSILNSIINHKYPKDKISNENYEDLINKKSTNNNTTVNNHKLLNTDLFKIFNKSHPSEFKNPLERVNTVTDISLPTIADYKNKIYYNNYKCIDINKKENNNNSKVFYNICRSKNLKVQSLGKLSFKSNLYENKIQRPKSGLF
ncbi:hypothetical protein LY90DRAFT_664009 [Neocallimastix californiae]|uniref:Uncharacterized protein n=1 Tax=Neocallimastix californiae TaxID=1754190 RepID=A0A1Y2FG07_9FUNG|nr:hypothetical protein LY90DRAFT_664009 [Neocallimastix californiae]|eukprot:ORY82851.1 hypothetical protein LY90DRAFT_664009 [Neocallimastix californiae]